MTVVQYLPPLNLIFIILVPKVLPLFTSLMPVALLISLGFWVAKLRVVTELGANDLTRLTFNVLAPSLLFHTMSEVHLEELNIQPILLYFFVALSIFSLVIALLGFSRRSTVLGLASTYSNTTMIGVPLIGLVYGAPGLVYLFTLISVHAIILLTTATVVLELSLLREQASGLNVGEIDSLNTWSTVAKALRNATLHPVPLPIIGGIIFSYFGWHLPQLIEQPIVWVGLAFSPLALMLVGISLYMSTNAKETGSGVNVEVSDSQASAALDAVTVNRLNATHTQSRWRVVGTLTFVKNIANPIIVLCIGHWVGVQGLALSVMVLAASMPIGANVFLFAQRYRVSQSEITIAVSVSTAAAMGTVPFVMWFAKSMN